MAIPELVELVARVSDLERRVSGMIRHGKVDQVDTKKQELRLDLGKDVDGKKFLSPWISYAQMAGALKVHTPPSVGQQYTSISPTGEWQQAVAIPFTWSDQNKSPSDKQDENVLTFGNVRIELRGDEIVVKCPELVLDAICHVGGRGGKPASIEGTVTSDGAVDVGNFATRVFHK